MTESPDRLSRAQGCLAGQLAGDALGSQVEFKPPAEIASLHPQGVRTMAPSPVWDTIAGQPTDDSEMALALARTLVRMGRFELPAVRAAYVSWYHSGPFDCGLTIGSGLTGTPNPASQANGALMRIAPLGIFGVGKPVTELACWAALDAGITHPHKICLETNILFVAAIAYAIETGVAPGAVWHYTGQLAEKLRVSPALLQALKLAETESPADFISQQGWVLIAFQNAFFHLLHTRDVESAIVSTIARGGDTDTNAAIAGALLGSVHGIGNFPPAWIETLRHCRLDNESPQTRHPRPATYWPVDFMELAAQLLAA